MNYLPLEVLSHIFSFLPSIEDRKTAGMVCKLWYDAYQTRALRKKEILIISSNSVFEELYAYVNEDRIYSNICVRGVDINKNTRRFWRRFAPFIRELSLNSCDIREKSFVKLILKCEEIEYLSIQDCKELFMSGTLAENQHQRAALRNVLKNLKSLALGYNRYLSDSLFARFTDMCPNIKELLLPGCYISFHSSLYNKFYQNGHEEPSENVLTFTVIHDYIKKNATRLKLLSFSETLIDSEAVSAIGKTPDLALDKLYLRGCVQITNESLTTLTEYQSFLTHLDVGLCPRITDATLLTICARLTGLKMLSVQGCRNISDAGVSELWKLTQIVHLNIAECERIHDSGLIQGLGSRPNKTLQELYMSHLIHITDKSVSQIMECLPNLLVLDLGYCFKAITDRAVQAIFTKTRRLTTLILTMCDALSDRGITGIALELPPSLNSKEARLREFMKTREDISAVTDENERREILEILGSLDDTADLRGGCLRHLKELQNLTLSGCNRVSDLSIKFGFKFKDLKRLDLSACQLITADGLFYISEYNKSLEVLNLDNCHNVDDEGVGHLLKKLQRLKSLTLGSNKITDRILHALGDSSPCLTFLDVRHCNQLTAATVNRIISFYPNLQVVHFSTKSNDFQYTAFHFPPPTARY